MSHAIEVMIVDDEPDIRFMLRMYLGRAGFAIEREANNGAEAVDLVRSGCPEAVLLDIGMPVMDGIEATWHIRDACPRTKIIILSAFSAPSLVEEAISRGADLYLEKTTPPNEIAAAVERLCRAA
jgi:DNA-binding NarL/FixJ family response regulator